MNLTGDKALAYCRKPSGDARVFLLFGSDEGVTADAAHQLSLHFVSSSSDNIRMQEEDVKRDPALLQEEMSARALLGGAQVIRLRVTSEAINSSLKAILEDLAAGSFFCENPLIIEAGELGKKSKLRTFCETSSVVKVLHFFADDVRGTADFVARQLSDRSVEITTDAMDAFVAELPGDRRLANSEIEKLSLYAVGLGRPLNISDIHAIAASEQPRGADDAADAALSGKAALAIQNIDRFLDAGGSAVSGLRTLHFRLMRALDAHAGATYLRPPVFGAEKTAFNAMLKDWNGSRITRALTMIYAAEKVCKQGGAPADAALKTVIDRISQRHV